MLRESKIIEIRYLDKVLREIKPKCINDNKTTCGRMQSREAGALSAAMFIERHVQISQTGGRKVFE